MPTRDLSWHRAQAALQDLQALKKSLSGRLKRQDFRAATLYLAATLALERKADTALHLAQMLNRCRDYQASLNHLRTAHTLWPNDCALLRLLAETAMLAAEFSVAFAAWQDLLSRQKPQGPYPVLRAAACLHAIGAHSDAQDFIERQGDRLRKFMAREGVQMLRRGRASADIPARGLYLVAGNNGTGKSTLGHFLHAMGYAIIDADTEIASFCHKGRFSDLRYDLKRATSAQDGELCWSWPEIRVTDSFAAARKRNEPVFVIGGNGATVAPYIPRFRRVFHLVAPDAVIAERLARRNSLNHKVGSRGYEAALRRNGRELKPDYPAALIASDRPVWAVCADILTRLGAQAPAMEGLP